LILKGVTDLCLSFQFAIELAELLKYLEESPLGSVELVGINMNDFVITAGNHLKLVDLDDVVLEEKSCHNDEDCIIPTASLARMRLLFLGFTINSTLYVHHQ
jgi:hypothetical protein